MASINLLFCDIIWNDFPVRDIFQEVVIEIPQALFEKCLEN